MGAQDDGQAPATALTRLHASCVAFRRNAEPDVGGGSHWAGVLIRAPSGAGKSTFALRLIALGGRLVSDDQTLLELDGAGRLMASAPAPLFGVLEARGVGLVHLPALRSAPVAWVVDLGGDEPAERLPPRRKTRLLGVEAPHLVLQEGERAAAVLCCLLREGALLDPEAGLADFKGEA